MKIFIQTKSVFSYDRLKKYLPEHDVYPFTENEDGDYSDVFVYFAPKLAILDKEHPHYEMLTELCSRFNVVALEFYRNFDSVLSEVEDYAILNEDDHKEEEVKPSVEAYKQPDFSAYTEQLTQNPHEVKQDVARETYELEPIIETQIIEKEVEKITFASIPPKLVLVGSLYSGSGSTTFAINLAKMIASRNVKVAYIEYPGIKPYMFDYLKIEQHEQEGNPAYVDRYASMMRKTEQAPSIFQKDGVQWYVQDPRITAQEPNIDILNQLLITLRETPITIVDLSASWLNPAALALINQADYIYVCSEPDPIKIDWSSFMDGTEDEQQKDEHKIMHILKNLKHHTQTQHEYITTKYSDHVDLTEWNQCFDREPIAKLPYIPYPIINKAIWESDFLYNKQEYFKMFEEHLAPIIKQLLPPGFQQLETSAARSVIHRFKNKFKGKRK